MKLLTVLNGVAQRSKSSIKGGVQKEPQQKKHEKGNKDQWRQEAGVQRKVPYGNTLLRENKKGNSPDKGRP